MFRSSKHCVSSSPQISSLICNLTLEKSVI
jgi:hypothetical protein